MPTGMQFNSAIPTPTMPRPGYGAPQIDYSRLGGLSPYNAVQSLITSGLSPEQAYSAYQSWSATGQGPQTSWSPMGQQYGQQSGRLQTGPAAGPQLQPQSGPLPSQSGTPHPAGGFSQGPLNTPYNMSPFYLDPGANPGAGFVPSGDMGGKIVPPRGANPIGRAETPTEQARSRLEEERSTQSGRFALAPPDPQQAQRQMNEQTGMARGSNYNPSLPLRENQYNSLVAGGMSPERARGIAYWNGQGDASALSWQNDPRYAQQAQQYRNATAANARGGPAPMAAPYGGGGVSHSGGALTPQYQPPKPQYPTPGYTGIAGGQGNSINTYGTPTKGMKLGYSGYYAA